MVSNHSMHVFFFDENEGWTVGNFGTIPHTFDREETWTKEADGITNNFIQKILSVNKNCVYFYASDGYGLLLKYVGEE